MTNVMTASREWATRPDDQRFLSLEDLKASVDSRKAESWTLVTPVKDMRMQLGVEGGLALNAYDQTHGERRDLVPSNWAFSQLAQYANAPAAYLRKLPDQLAAINLQWGLENNPIREDSLILGQTNGHNNLRAMTSTTYGRIWDSQVVEAVQKVNPDNRWQVPASSYTTLNPKRATTLYASDRDVFIFLVDPNNEIDVGGEKLYRGFYTWNSEVGSATFGLTTFLYRYICDNRIIWGATNVNELKIRHTGGAPQRFAYEGSRYLERYAEESAEGVVAGIKKAQAFELPKDETEGKDGDGWNAWLLKRGFTKAQAANAVTTAKAEEGEARSLWDVINGLTANALQIPHTNDRVDLETKAGALMRFVS